MCEWTQTGEQCWRRLASMLRAFRQRKESVTKRSKEEEHVLGKKMNECCDETLCQQAEASRMYCSAKVMSVHVDDIIIFQKKTIVCRQQSRHLAL